MNTYAVKRINLKNVKTVDDYWNEVRNATIKYCNGLKEVEIYCGGKLHRQRTGSYAGINGNIQYVAKKC